MRKRRSPREVKSAHPLEKAKEMSEIAHRNVEVGSVDDKSKRSDGHGAVFQDAYKPSSPSIHEVVSRQLSVDLANALERVADLETECTALQAANADYQVEIARFNERLERRDSEIALLTRRLIEIESNGAKESDNGSKVIELLLHAVKSSEKAVLSQLSTDGMAVRDDFSIVDRRIAELRNVMDQQTQEIEALAKAYDNEIQKKNRRNYPFRSVFKSLEKSRKTKELIKLVEESGLFDSRWYAEKHPEMVSSGISPVKYFVDRGLFEDHDPGPNFSCEKYRKKYADVAKAKTPAFLHFLRYGKFEGRVP